MTDDERVELIAHEPAAKKWTRRFVGAKEFINGGVRWCLWLKDLPPGALAGLPKVRARVERVKAYRRASTREATKRLAAVPSLFGEIRQPEGEYLLVPRHSSERRAFIPIGFMSPTWICGDANLLIPNASLFHFGVLSSSTHMAWVRTVCGRIKSDFRYTNEIVYNNFPWPVDATEKQREAIEHAAHGVINARASFPDATLAELYDPLSMPAPLVKAHQMLDRAVDAAYAGCGGKKTWMSDAERVAFLFGLYQQATSLLPDESPKASRKKPKNVVP